MIATWINLQQRPLTLHQLCGIFLNFFRKFQSHVSSFYPGSDSSPRKNRNREPLGGKEEALLPVGLILELFS
jgi:hypothetical protein